MNRRYSEKYQHARGTLPVGLRPEFDKLVEHYRYAATKHYGQPYVSYVVLAELIFLGWRDVEEDITPELLAHQEQQGS